MVDKFHLPIDNAPELAAALGRFIAYWGHLESLLIHLLQLLLNVDNVKARFIYLEFVSITAKINLLQRLNHFYTLDDKLKYEIYDLLKDTTILNEKRDGFVHAMWVGAIPQHIMRIETTIPRNFRKYKKSMIKITPHKVQEEVDKIGGLYQKFQDLILRLIGVLEKQP